MLKQTHRTAAWVLAHFILQRVWTTGAAGVAQRASHRENGGKRAVSWDAVPRILARIKPPKFPARDFKITDSGAVAGGHLDSTEAIRKAIAACSAAGGGRVSFQ